MSDRMEILEPPKTFCQDCGEECLPIDLVKVPRVVRNWVGYREVCKSCYGAGLWKEANHE